MAHRFSHAMSSRSRSLSALSMLSLALFMNVVTLVGAAPCAVAFARQFRRHAGTCRPQPRRREDYDGSSVRTYSASPTSAIRS